jgi:hydroxymethylbilane synthase
MTEIVKIGTRDSELALWQAKKVQSLLQERGIPSVLVHIKSEGDIDLSTPLYEIGVQGIFTKTLDIALLQNRIDIAVHSFKDVPTQPAKGVVTAAVLKRDAYTDILVFGDNREDTLAALDPGGDGAALTIATSSIRRRAQWLHRYPGHRMENLRGNVNTRLKKLAESNWHGAIFAAAGLERIGIRPAGSIDLAWMLPAPAQGAVAVACRESDERLRQICAGINDHDTAVCTGVERDFLKTLMGGCTTPVSALATIEAEEIVFKGSLHSKDGRQMIGIEKRSAIAGAAALGKNAGTEVIQRGGDIIIESIKHGGE